MADRQEVEAVARAIGEADRLAPTDREVWLEQAEAAIAALDRVRAERVEADCEHGYLAAGGTATCPACEAERAEGDDPDNTPLRIEVVTRQRDRWVAACEDYKADAEVARREAEGMVKLADVLAFLRRQDHPYRVRPELQLAADRLEAEFGECWHEAFGREETK